MSGFWDVWMSASAPRLFLTISEGTQDLSPEPTTELSESVLIISTAAWEGCRYHPPPILEMRTQALERVVLPEVTE